ncbi:MAG: D-glycerate 2-kinase [uncultured Thermomicrobiales bacterium]|uniref:D-glycerate 2-kinase n=1 Tax=uncultured Thermomicrobiales bacterium TaxID=1645740 RepID=A0A6J4UGT1_9BACT|nr:MAG: D-glycerate 2-kinase [uncultured Thermomicrobiales bacterium]
MSWTRPRTLGEAQTIVSGLLAVGLTAVDPRRKVAESLVADPPTAGNEPLMVVAIGKAATAMAAGARDVLGDRISAGIILTKDGHSADPLDDFFIFEAAHPVPDQRGVDATRTIIDALAGLDAGAIVLTLLSGGGSSLLELPRPPVTLADLQVTTSLVLRAGAPIEHLNAVRGELSMVKGGGLRRQMGRARCITLILSDVLGNDPRVIASGPTIHRTPDPEGALRLLHQYDLSSRLPASVLDALSGDQLLDESGLDETERDEFRILADNDVLIDAIVAEAERLGLNTSIAWRRQEGEARELGRSFARKIGHSEDDVDMVIGGGEATVTVRGNGNGGRNTEFTLAAGLELTHATTGDRWAVASIASDGQDGSVDAAGAITSAASIRATGEGGLDPLAALAENDSGGYFDRTGELIRTGPTGTNVNDVMIGLRLAG